MNQTTDRSESRPAATADGVREIGVDRLWETLRSDPDAVLVDVRTRAEWAFVGVPDLSGLGREPLLVEWQSYPRMKANPAFVETVGDAAKDRDAPLFLLCRSGARSRAAAAALAAAGHARCFNVTEGFEGPRDSRGHRGGVSGWKAQGLPWTQS